MKRTKKVLSMALALITALLLIPAIPVYADSEYDLSQTINEANGDGRTPFNPQWVDGANGIVSFDVQNPELYSDMVYLVYRVRVYLDKNYIGEEEIGTKVGSSTATVDISEYMDGDGEYEFVVYFYDGMNSPKNIAKSATYVRGAPRPSAVTGSSTSQPLSLPVRAANTISFSRAIKADNTLWNWASGTPKNIMDNVKAISIYPDSAAIIKTDGSGWYDDGDQEYVKVTDNAAFISQGESFSFIDGNGGLWLELDSALTHVADNVVDAASNLMLKKDGTVWIYSDRTNSVSVYDRIDNVVSIAASDDLFAAVKANGSLYTFMDDADSYPEFIADNVKTVYSSYNYPDAHVRFNYMAFIKNDGSLWMWGRNDWDKINAEPYHFETPVKVMDNVVSASLGGNTSTALTADGTVWEWGEYTQSSAPKIVMDGIKLPGDITPITPIAPEQPATPAQPTAPPAAPIQPATPGITVSPTASEVFVNGVSKSFEAYNIEGSNYFKLRDLAFVVSGTAKQFNVGYDGATQAITITTGQPYVPAGGEMTMGDGSAKTAEPTASRIYLDGAELNPTVYNIGGNNFFNLVDMVSALNIGVTYNETTGAIGIDTNANFMGVVTVSGEQPIVPPPVNYADTPTPEPTLPPPVEMPVPTPAPVPATPNVNNEENYVRSEFSVDLDENNNPVEIYGVEIFFKGVKPDIQQSDITDITLTLNGKAVAIDGFDVTKMFVEDEETGATHTSYFLMIYPWFADSGTYSFSCKILGVECSTGAFNL